MLVRRSAARCSTLQHLEHSRWQPRPAALQRSCRGSASARATPVAAAAAAYSGNSPAAASWRRGACVFSVPQRCNHGDTGDCEATLADAIEDRLAGLLDGVADDMAAQGWAQVDGVLGPAAVETMRAEAVSLRQAGQFVQSYSLDQVTRPTM